MLVPGDHHIVDTQAQDAAQAAGKLASEDWLVAFGIAATAPETGYGYIRRGDPLGEGHQVHSFVEKPDLETALGFLAQGGYAWNGGIFAFRAGFFLSELTKYRPDMVAAARAAFEQRDPESQDIRPAAAQFDTIASESVDYALMENTDRAAMVDVSMGWSDIGNWDALLLQRVRRCRQCDCRSRGNHRRKRFDDRQRWSPCHLDRRGRHCSRRRSRRCARDIAQRGSRVGEASRCKKP